MDYEQIIAESKASQNKHELSCLLEVLETIDPWRILEIGVHQGYSMEVWKKAFPDAEIIGIENDPHAIDAEAIRGCTLIKGDSHDIAVYNSLVGNTKGPFIDFLFIDGDHTFQGVKLDFELYMPLVRRGGIVAIHDASLVTNPGVEVFEFWDTIKNMYRTELVTGKPGGTGTGIIYL